MKVLKVMMSASIVSSFALGNSGAMEKYLMEFNAQN